MRKSEEVVSGQEEQQAAYGRPFLLACSGSLRDTEAMKGKSLLPILISLAVFLLGALLYTAGYFALATATDIGSAMFRIFPTQWLAHAYHPAGQVEALVIKKKVVLGGPESQTSVHR